MGNVWLHCVHRHARSPQNQRFIELRRDLTDRTEALPVCQRDGILADLA